MVPGPARRSSTGPAAALSPSDLARHLPEWLGEGGPFIPLLLPTSGSAGSRDGSGPTDPDATGADELDGGATGDGPVTTGDPHDRIARATTKAHGRRGGRSTEDPTVTPDGEFSPEASLIGRPSTI